MLVLGLIMDSLENNSNTSFYADALGSVEPNAVENFEEGKVELSVPMKYVSKPKSPKPKQKSKNQPLPKGKAVPVFSNQTYVDEEGVEHMVPPSYDKSNMNLPKAKFQKPADMPEVMDDNQEAVPEEETPAFLQNWQNESEVDEIDRQLNSLLDDDVSLDFSQTTDNEDKTPASTLTAGDKLDNGRPEPVDNKMFFQKQNTVSPRGAGAFSSADLLKEFSASPKEEQENEDIDLENLDAIIAAHSPAQEEIKVEELGNDEVMSGDAKNREDVEARAAIPSFDDAENIGDVKNSKFEKPIFEVEPEVKQEDIVIPDVETIEPQIVADDNDVVFEPKAENNTFAEPTFSMDESVMGAQFVSDVEENVQQEADVVDAKVDAALPEEVVPEVEQKATIEDDTLSEVDVSDVSSEIASNDEAMQVSLDENEEEKAVSGSLNLFGENKFAQEYSLGLAENYKVISAQNMPKFLTGDDKVNAIQINAGESDYGWSVVFDNGIVMGISDVRRYQLQFGALPSANGVIAYGQQKMGFNRIKKIVLYQTPKYFRYTL